MISSRLDLKNAQNTTKLVKTILTFTAVAAIFVCLFFGFSRYSGLKSMNTKSSTLTLLTNFDTTTLAKDPQTKDLYPTWKTLDDMIASTTELDLEKERYNLYLETLQYPYKNFTQYLLLPSLNIWQNVYTQEIDTSLMGPKFLERNPYTKLAMIDKRSSFFRNVGDTSQFNDITDISIGNIQAEKGVFRIPITLSFTSPSKRSFLLLVEKLSMTSNKSNIALLNEFMYNLREEVKVQKKDKLENFGYPGVLKDEKNINRKLGYILYSELFDPDYDKGELLTEEVIEETIRKSASCPKAKTPKCYYLFRDKYREIPYLAYTIGSESTSKVTALKNFLKELPPLMQIKEFTFDKSRQAEFLQQGNAYEGKVSVDIIGRDVPDTDVVGVAKLLGKTCFQEEVDLSAEKADEKIQKFMAELSHLTVDNVSKGQELADLKEVIEEVKAGYAGQSNYNKIIKLFEIYRMLHDASICVI